MQLVAGHVNPDFDSYGSMVAACRLFPGAKAVFLGSQNATVRAFHNLHEEFLSFVDLRAIDPDDVDLVVMVDTRDPDRLGEVGRIAERSDVRVIVFDHHPAQPDDITGVDDRSVDCGATTSILAHALCERGIVLTPLEASVMLLGIYDDTGSLTYPATSAFDLDAASWLMGQGGELDVVSQYLTNTLAPAQEEVLRQLTDSLQVWEFNGQRVAVGVARAEDYVDSAGVLSHYIAGDLGFPVAVAVVAVPGRTQVLARSRLPEVDVGEVMARLGGGGHPQAASANVRDASVESVLLRLRAAFESIARPPVRAGDVMSSPVRSIAPHATMTDAANLMAKWGHGGLPVMDGDSLLGLVTRKDVDKARRHELGHAPVTGFMTRDVWTVTPHTEVREIERTFASRGIGRTPVVDEGRVVGIVTRKDVLRAAHGDRYVGGVGAPAVSPAVTRFASAVDRLLPHDVSTLLHTIGEVAHERATGVHVVGGFVRDMLLGVPNLDVDVVVEGDGIAFAEAVAERLSAQVRVHRRFGTAVVTPARGIHVDVASARAEYYTKPGALPTVERSSLRQDLLRRDFSINAMAASIDPSSFGQLADPFSALADLDAGVVRVLHALSFVEDPTRIVRAARFEVRYGFRMDASTEALARQAVTLGVMDEVSGTRFREELLGVLDEERPGEVLRRVAELGALQSLVPARADAEQVVAAVNAAAASYVEIGQLLGDAKATRRETLLTAIAGTVPAAGAERWVRHMRMGRSLSGPTVLFAQRKGRVLGQLRSSRTMRDSRLYRMLEPLPGAVLVNLHADGDPLVRERVERYITELARVRPAVSGSDLIALGAQPGASFSAILARAHDDRLDGRAVGREAELANLSRLAQRAGLIGPRKDSA